MAISGAACVYRLPAASAPALWTLVWHCAQYRVACFFYRPLAGIAARRTITATLAAKRFFVLLGVGWYPRWVCLVAVVRARYGSVLATVAASLSISRKQCSSTTPLINFPTIPAISTVSSVLDCTGRTIISATGLIWTGFGTPLSETVGLQSHRTTSPSACSATLNMAFGGRYSSGNN